MAEDEPSNLFDASSDEKHVEQPEKINQFAIRRPKHVYNELDLLSASKMPLCEIESFNHVAKSNNIMILERDGDFYVCGVLFIKSSTNESIIKKLCIDKELNHQMIPPLAGFDSSNDGSKILEIRKTNFEPVPFTKEFLSGATQVQIYNIVLQIIEFINYISKMRYSVSLLALDDIFSFCFLDGDFNLYFGDLSFIDIDYCYHKNLFSIGMIVYQLLGHEIMIDSDEKILYPEFKEIVSDYWREFIKSCFIEKVHVPSFYSQFILKSIEEKANLFSFTELEDNELEEAEIEIENNPEENVSHRKIEFINCNSMKEIIERYKDLKLDHVIGKTDHRFTELKAEIMEDGKSVFIEEILSESSEESLALLKLHLELHHPMILPLKGFSCSDPTYKNIFIYMVD